MSRYRPTLKDRLFDIFLWIRHIGWMYLVGLIVLGVVGYGLYALATASPVAKLSITLSGFLVYNLVNEIAKRIPHRTEGENKKLGASLGCICLFAMPVTIYGLILSAFVIPGLFSIIVGLGLIMAIVLTFMNEKKIKISAPVIWVRNLVTLSTYAVLAFYLAKFAGWL